jgi:hypothetical protein
MFAGRYEMVSSENYDEYLKAIGVDMVARKLANNSKPTIEITENGQNINLKTITTFKTVDLNFILGEEFEEETEAGYKAKTTINQDGNRLVQVLKLDGLEAHKTRTFTGSEMIEEIKAGGVTSKRVYCKV